MLTETEEYGGYAVNGTSAIMTSVDDMGPTSDYTLAFQSNTSDSRTFYLVLESVDLPGYPIATCKVYQKGGVVKAAPS